MEVFSGRRYFQATFSVILTFLFVLVCAGPCISADFLVTNTQSSGVGSLRQAILGSESPGDSSNTISFQQGLTGTIFLESDLPGVSKELTINGPGQTVLAIDGQNTYRGLEIEVSGIAHISDLTIQNCNVGYGYGGGIRTDGTLSLTRCTLTGNVANGGGGGLYIGSGEGQPVTLIDCTISGNTGGSGAGIQSSGETTISLTGCTLSGNISSDAGGGIYNEEGIYFITNCTLSGNRADDGGGIFNEYPNRIFNLTNCTITQNSADYGGGIWNDNGGVVNSINSIIAGNQATEDGENCWEDAPVDNGGNIQYPNNDCGATIPIADPLLGPLQDNGGLTLTHALLSGSPAIDNVPDGYCNVNSDQRGVSRPIDGDGSGTPLCDSGSYEYEVNNLPPLPDGSGNTAAVPTLSQWGLILLSLLMIGSAAWFIRRRNRTS